MASPDKTPLETPAHELVERGRAYLDLYRKWEAAEAKVVRLQQEREELLDQLAVALKMDRFELDEVRLRFGG